MTQLYSSVRQEKVGSSGSLYSHRKHRLTLFGVLDWEGKAAFQKYLNKGGNFVGTHSASDTLKTTTSYRLEVGQ
jgi:hypothetical protein